MRSLYIKNQKSKLLIDCFINAVRIPLTNNGEFKLNIQINSDSAFSLIKKGKVILSLSKLNRKAFFEALEKGNLEHDVIDKDTIKVSIFDSEVKVNLRAFDQDIQSFFTINKSNQILEIKPDIIIPLKIYNEIAEIIDTVCDLEFIANHLQEKRAL